MSEPRHKDEPETDPRFPSGRWVGFFVQKELPPGRHPTELFLKFSQGLLSGEGRDRFGEFTVQGLYNLADGRCHWTKQYTGKDAVLYDGFNEGRGIWGTWHIAATPQNVALKGGFHIWPDNIPDPTGQHLTEAAEAPTELVSV
jgi:hypothetical protein